MKIHLVYSTLCFLLVCLLPQTSNSCTSFFLDQDDQLVSAKNYDFYSRDCLVIVNKRGVSKVATLGPTREPLSQSAKWTSKHGSVTFSMGGREVTSDGMNETGLVITSLDLMETKYPRPDKRPSMIMGQWIQYQLDNFSTVKEVIASDSQLRIRPESPRCHFLVCDRMGDSAIIEFIDGKIVCYTDKKMPIKTLTNTIYSEAVKFWEQDKLPSPDPFFSVRRFVHSANMLDSKNSTTTIDYAFDILEAAEWTLNTEIGGKKVQFDTQLSMVFDLKNLCIYFLTLKNKKIRYINVSSFDFSCKTPVKVLDVHEDLSGDVTSKFMDYTQQINRNFIGKAFKNHVFLRNVPENNLDIISRYPESTICTDK
jgi:penicillin V acylase-like amidase (Ntn superfamily)